MFKWIRNWFSTKEYKFYPGIITEGEYVCILCRTHLSQGSNIWVSAGDFGDCKHEWITKDADDARWKNIKKR
jgi:hypothetical protein